MTVPCGETRAVTCATGTDPSPPEVLVDAVSRVLEPWLVSAVVATARSHIGHCPEDLVATARSEVQQQTPAVLADLRELLATDVDEQRDTPLGVLRRAVAIPTQVLVAAGIPALRRDTFAREAFPDDVYGLTPATWSDVDSSLHEPGLIWGAWKAKTVLDRRRHEGRR